MDNARIARELVKLAKELTSGSVGPMPDGDKFLTDVGKELMKRFKGKYFTEKGMVRGDGPGFVFTSKRYRHIWIDLELFNPIVKDDRSAIFISLLGHDSKDDDEIVYEVNESNQSFDTGIGVKAVADIVERNVNRLISRWR